ncbi:hypothetical protein ES703_33683 [subsurface metagenome]
MKDVGRTINYSMLKYLERLYSDHSPKMSFKAETKGEWKIWQAEFREKIIELFGCFPPCKVPLKPSIFNQEEEEFYTKEKVIFESMPGISVVGYLIIPRDVTFPCPALLCPPGHGWGKVDGIEKGEYCDYGVRFAEQGYITFVMDHIGFGERTVSDREEDYPMDYKDRNYSLMVNVCHLFGMSIQGFRIYDLIRSLDYLETRDEVESNRIGCVGLSLGGELTTFLAALDERVKVSIVSGWFNTFKDTLLVDLHCICSYVSGILKYGEVYDIAGLIAPRPLLIQTGRKDKGFPTASAVKAYNMTKRVYKLLGAEDRIDLEVFDGGHAFNEKKAFPWIKKWL